MVEAVIKKFIRDVPDFPKQGIIFKDITPLLHDHAAFGSTIAKLVERYSKMDVDLIVGIESRGFLFGTPLAHQLKTGFVPVRKKGKLPYETVSVSYDLEYGSATIEMHTDAVKKGQRIVVIDDLLATGGTAGAACKLLTDQGATVVECAFIVELEFLNGREKLGDTPVFSLACYS